MHLLNSRQFLTWFFVFIFFMKFFSMKNNIINIYKECCEPPGSFQLQYKNAYF